MPIKPPFPSEKIIARIEQQMAEKDIVMEAIARNIGEILSQNRKVPGKFWLLSGMAVETLPIGTTFDENILLASRPKCLRFFIGLDDGGYVECDFIPKMGIISFQYVQHSDWMNLIGRAFLLWGRQTVTDNIATLFEFPELNLRGIRARGDDPGVIFDELWDGGSKGIPMTESDFSQYLLALYEGYAE